MRRRSDDDTIMHPRALFVKRRRVKDLVCRMWVDLEPAAAMSEYKGKKYYFCARGREVAFDRGPEKYIRSEGDEWHQAPGRSPALLPAPRCP